MLHHVENSTTAKIGQSVATVIADTYCNTRITTLELVYPRYIHSELMTHRVFSRNASSSRATPIEVLLKEVREDPVFFDFVGKNCKGMVASEPLCSLELAEFKRDWYELSRMVADKVEYMSTLYEVHKQTLNRALEPFSRIRTLVTATDWVNFFKLRLAPDTQPEMHNLALAIKQAMALSDTKKSAVHIPYVTERGLDTKTAMLVSAARCARVSYARHDGKPTDIDADLELSKRLLKAGHLSPFEHMATATEGADRYANFKGWRSYRNQMGY